MPAAKTLREIDNLLAEYVELENRHLPAGVPTLVYKNVSTSRDHHPLHHGVLVIGELLHRCKSSGDGATVTLKDLARIVNHYCDDIKTKRVSMLAYLNKAIECYNDGLDPAKAIKRARIKVDQLDTPHRAGSTTTTIATHQPTA